MTVEAEQDLVLLRDSAREWLTYNAPFATDPVTARSDAAGLWRQLVKLGWPGILVSEPHGGLGLEAPAAGVLLEELGRHLIASPFLSTAVIAVEALRHSAGGGFEQLTAIAGGSCQVGIWLGAHDSRAVPSPGIVATPMKDGWQLDGSLRYALDATNSDAMLLVVGPKPAHLFLIPTAHCTLTPLDSIDGRNLSHVHLDKVAVGEDELIRGSAQLPGFLLDLARLGIASEMNGAAAKALEITVTYLGEREQFGRPIGSFQALQHRAAQALVNLELARAAVASAWRSAALNNVEFAAAATLAKYMAGCALHLISNEMIQMHGGIGMTAEHPAGRYLKWARMSEHLFGGQKMLLDRYSTLNDF